MKKEELIKGKWYKSITTEYLINYMKYSHHDGDKVYHTEKIVFGEYYNKTEYWNNSIMVNALELLTDLTDLTEIQQYLPDGHEDKVKPASAILGAEATKGFLLPKSERYLVTMKFFNELKEPERSQAIENYDENRYGIPSSLSNALMNGFVWGNSKQGYKYWDDIRDSIINKTYFKEPEVFGKYKIGDIVVSLTAFGSIRTKGDIFVVRNSSNRESLCYAIGYSNNYPANWRLATPEEAEAYNSGIRNINDIKETEVLVFGKYKIGDIVVSLTAFGSIRTKGDIFVVREDSTINKLSYAYSYNSRESNIWRLATLEEAEAYRNGIKNINDIKEPKVLVFGKYKIGDIVVSITELSLDRCNGNIYKVLQKSDTNNLFYRNSAYSTISNTWRLATQTEIFEYNKGIRNVNDIVKKGDWIVLLKPIQGFDVGKLYPVTDMSGDRLWKIQGMNCQIDREYYRKATREECIINDNRILNLNIKPRNTIMKLYVEITADMNDGDYISERTEIDETWISKFQPLIDSIIQNDCNWSKGECIDTTFIDQYDEFEKDLLYDFNDYVPYGEHGVHRITELVILKVESEDIIITE